MHVPTLLVGGLGLILLAFGENRALYKVAANPIDPLQLEQPWYNYIPPISCLSIGKHCHNVTRVGPRIVMWCAAS